MEKSVKKRQYCEKVFQVKHNLVHAMIAVFDNIISFMLHINLSDLFRF